MLKNWQGKVKDYRHFGIVLLAIGAMFFLGALLPMETRTSTQQLAYMIISFLSLCGSTLYFLKARKYKKFIDNASS
ncbi:YrhC family protein [Mangrovibacillus cuniculi]|uniref:YrhC-like protein n=1 Tax=Mangrovibacillus cuniculi TaxID=2593652 RepID=A0A7S8CBP4_9BACI|nr:YrhC family protein [Mangrovibacillus cuniculi]QPC46977.1 hypothetical protein G8O30_08380 [Mangrovibacillus cuniculi]